VQKVKKKTGNEHKGKDPNVQANEIRKAREKDPEAVNDFSKSEQDAKQHNKK